MRGAVPPIPTLLHGVVLNTAQGLLPFNFKVSRTVAI